MLFGEMGFYFAALAVYILVGLVRVYTMFLIALSRVALAVLLAVRAALHHSDAVHHHRGGSSTHGCTSSRTMRS